MTESRLPHDNPLANAVDTVLAAKPGADRRTLLYAIRNMGESLGVLDAYLKSASIAWPVAQDQTGATGKNSQWEVARHHLIHASNDVVQNELATMDPATLRAKMQNIREHVQEHAMPELVAMKEHILTLPMGRLEKEQAMTMIDQLAFQSLAFVHGAKRVANDKPAYDARMAKEQINASVFALQDSYSVAEASLQVMQAETPEAFDKKEWEACTARIRASMHTLMNDPLILTKPEHIDPLGHALLDANEMLKPIRDAVRTGGQGRTQSDATIALSRLASDLSCITAQVSDVGYQMGSIRK